MKPLPLELMPNKDLLRILSSRFDSVIFSGVPKSNRKDLVVSTYVKGSSSENLSILGRELEEHTGRHIKRIEKDQ